MGGAGDSSWTAGGGGGSVGVGAAAWVGGGIAGAGVGGAADSSPAGGRRGFPAAAGRLLVSPQGGSLPLPRRARGPRGDRRRPSGSTTSVLRLLALELGDDRLQLPQPLLSGEGLCAQRGGWGRHWSVEPVPGEPAGRDGQHERGEPYACTAEPRPPRSPRGGRRFGRSDALMVGGDSRLRPGVRLENLRRGQVGPGTVDRRRCGGGVDMRPGRLWRGHRQGIPVGIDGLAARGEPGVDVGGGYPEGVLLRPRFRTALELESPASRLAPEEDAIGTGLFAECLAHRRQPLGAIRRDFALPDDHEHGGTMLRRGVNRAPGPGATRRRRAATADRAAARRAAPPAAARSAPGRSTAGPRSDAATPGCRRP